MSGVSDGQTANDSTFNAAFMTRNGDTSTTGRVDLNNAVAASGASIANIQRVINSLASALGITTSEAFDALVTWATSNVGSASSSVKDKIDALDALFNGTTGHAHTGVDGDGAVVSAADLADHNDYWCVPERLSVSAASGLTFNASGAFSGLTPGGASAAEGVITDAPDNKVQVFKSTGEQIEDGSGNEVYARVTYSAGVWTLTFFVLDAGVETAHNLSIEDIIITYRNVYTSANRPTIGPAPNDLGTLNVTNDIVAATPTQSGKVTTTAQSFAGVKTFNAGVVIDSLLKLGPTVDSSTTGANAALAIVDPLLVLTNASLTSIGTLTGLADGQVFIIINKTGSSVTFIDEYASGTAAERLRTGTGSNLVVKNNACIFGVYTSNDSRTHIIGGAGGGSGMAIPMRWCPSTPGPVHTFDPLGAQWYEFQQADDSVLLLGRMKVPAGYTAGTQINMILPFIAASSSGTVKFVCAVSHSVYGAAKYTGGGSSSQTITTTMSGSNTGELVPQTFNLTDSAGLVGGTAVGPDDILTVTISRDATDTCTAVANLHYDYAQGETA